MNKKKNSVANKRSQSSMAEILNTLYDNHPNLISDKDFDNIDEPHHIHSPDERQIRRSRLKEKSHMFESSGKY